MSKLAPFKAIGSLAGIDDAFQKNLREMLKIGQEIESSHLSIDTYHDMVMKLKTECTSCHQRLTGLPVGKVSSRIKAFLKVLEEVVIEHRPSLATRGLNGKTFSLESLTVRLAVAEPPSPPAEQSRQS